MPINNIDKQPNRIDTTEAKASKNTDHWIERFRRVTSSAHYLPEVDGLRFLSLIMVVLVIHTTTYINVKLFEGRMIPNAYLKTVVVEGAWGVHLFFMISAFILSLPFARAAFLYPNKKRTSLKDYYVRRLVRIEPPYIIALLLFFVAHVWILGTYSFQGLLPHLGASLLYIHTLWYNQFSLVLPIAWTLEVEAQFYVMAPLFFLIFQIKHALLRRGLLVSIITFAIIYWKDQAVPGNLIRFGHFFLIGMLLADFYVNKVIFIRSAAWCTLIGWVALIALFLTPALYNSTGYFIKHFLLAFIFYIALTNAFWKRIFSIQWVAIIGGMCYSIYLLHFGILSVLGKAIQAAGIKTNNYWMLPMYFVVMIIAILSIAAVYFLAVEKPFMKLGLQRKAKLIAYNPE